MIKEYLIRFHVDNLKNIGFWMGELILRVRYGKNNVDGYDDVVRSISVADLKALACKIFQSGNRLVVGMKTPDSQTK